MVFDAYVLLQKIFHPILLVQAANLQATQFFSSKSASKCLGITQQVRTLCTVLKIGSKQWKNRCFFVRISKLQMLINHPSSSKLLKIIWLKYLCRIFVDKSYKFFCGNYISSNKQNLYICETKFGMCSSDPLNRFSGCKKKQTSRYFIGIFFKS